MRALPLELAALQMPTAGSITRYPEVGHFSWCWNAAAAARSRGCVESGGSHGRVCTVMRVTESSVYCSGWRRAHSRGGDAADIARVVRMSLRAVATTARTLGLGRRRRFEEKRAPEKKRMRRRHGRRRTSSSEGSVAGLVPLVALLGRQLAEAARGRSAGGSGSGPLHFRSPRLLDLEQQVALGRVLAARARTRGSRSAGAVGAAPRAMHLVRALSSGRSWRRAVLADRCLVSAPSAIRLSGCRGSRGRPRAESAGVGMAGCRDPRTGVANGKNDERQGDTGFQHGRPDEQARKVDSSSILRSLRPRPRQIEPEQGARAIAAAAGRPLRSSANRNAAGDLPGRRPARRVNGCGARSIRDAMK